MAIMPGMFKKGNGAPVESAPVADEIAKTAAPPEDEARKAEIARQVAQARHRIHLAVGQIVLALSAVARHRHQSLADLQALILDPLLRDRIAIATAAPKEGEATEDPPLAGVAIWASVSEEVDGKLREPIKAGAFPIHLKPEELTSGDKAWLLG